MRKDDEQLLTTYTVAVYGKTDELNDPSGSGSASPAEFSKEITDTLTDSIQSHIVSELNDNWGDANLRCEVTPIS